MTALLTRFIIVVYRGKLGKKEKKMNLILDDANISYSPRNKILGYIWRLQIREI